jgi:Di-N-acetylchitobiase
VLLEDFPKAELTNSSARSAFVAQVITTVDAYGLDGVNLDFEDYILPGDTADRDGLTALVQEMTAAVHALGPGLQSTFDVAWSPMGIDERFYDYSAISSAVDAIFIMSYDLQSQVFSSPCVAAANAPLDEVVAGVRNWTAIAPPSKCILGLPWYGFAYECVNTTDPRTVVCPIGPSDFRNATCSDAVGEVITAAQIPALAAHATLPITWNTTYDSPYFNYVDSHGTVFQAWFDNPQSLTLKSDVVHAFGLRGNGVWNLDCLNYTDNSPAGILLRDQFYAAFL